MLFQKKKLFNHHFQFNYEIFMILNKSNNFEVVLHVDSSPHLNLFKSKTGRADQLEYFKLSGLAGWSTKTFFRLTYYFIFNILNNLLFYL